MNFTFGPKRDDLLSSSEFVSGLVTGALIGLAAGILVAPRSGKDTRKKLAGAASQQADDLADQWNDAKSGARKEIDTIKTKVSDSSDKAIDKLDSYGNKVAHKAENLTHKAEDKADDLADDAKSAIDKVKDVFRIS